MPDPPGEDDLGGRLVVLLGERLDDRVVDDAALLLDLVSVGRVEVAEGGVWGGNTEVRLMRVEGCGEKKRRWEGTHRR